MIIVQRLREIQNRFGYLPDREMEQLARLVGVPLYRVEEVASFFPAFRLERDKPAVLEVRVCRDMACHHRGADALMAAKGPLGQLTRDAQFQAQLAAAAPGWAAAAREEAQRKGQPIEFPDPEPAQCELHVEGVSCLGRCDRAPAVWVERHPMPHAEHAWTFAPKPGELTASFIARLVESLRAIAANKPVAADPDEGYEPFTNVGHSAPIVRKVSPEETIAAFLPHSRSAAWMMDLYLGRERTYDAVRRVATSLKEKRGLAPWASRDEIKQRYTSKLDDHREKIDKSVARSLVEALEKKPNMSPAERAAKEKEIRGREEDRLREELFIKDVNPHLWKMKDSGLQGMGGAGMPAYQKWLDVWRATPQDTAQAPAKYIVANGDESEPGTFKDRELLLRMSHLVIEGVILAGLMTGATAGYIFIRHEYHEQIEAVEREIARAERLGACGDDIFGSGVSFPVSVFESPGGYICGEQSALIEAMEDHRGQPRNRPPDLQSNGLWDMPTVVNNVETLSWAPFIVENGGAKYAGSGYKVPKTDLPAELAKTLKDRTVEFSGRRLFSISGDVNRPGVYDVPIGIPLRHLVMNMEYCGGVAEGKDLKAVATSGPSGGLLPAFIPMDVENLKATLPDILQAVRSRPGPDGDRFEWLVRQYVIPKGGLDLLDLPLDLNVFRNVNRLIPFKAGGDIAGEYPEIMLGAGIVVYAEGTDTFDAAVNFSTFFRNESCGKCVPCRIGSQKLVQIGTDLLARRDGQSQRPDPAFPAIVKEVMANVPQIARAMKMTSICALGAVAPSPIWSALEYFPDEVLKKPEGTLPVPQVKGK